MFSVLLQILQAVIALSAKVTSLHRGTIDTLKSIQDDQTVIKGQLEQVLDLLTQGTADHLIISAHLEDGTTLKDITHMDMRDDQQVQLTIQPVDKKGKPALVDGVPVWAGSDDTVILVTAAADGMSANVVGVAPGTARVVVTADADLGTGVTNITGTLDFNITGGAAATVTITAGTPVDQ